MTDTQDDAVHRLIEEADTVFVYGEIHHSPHEVEGKLVADGDQDISRVAGYILLKLAQQHDDDLKTAGLKLASVAAEIDDVLEYEVAGRSE